MAFCTQCGSKLGDDARFCSSCGSSISGTVAVANKATAVEKTAPTGMSDAESQWTSFARRVYQDINKNGKYTGKQVQVTVSPMLFGQGESRIVQASYIEYVFTGIGDGSTNYDPLGGAFVSAVNSNAGFAYHVGGLVNSYRAKRNAKPHWVEAGQGEFIITNNGLVCIDKANGIITLKHNSFISAKMTAWNRIEMDFHDANNRKTIKVSFQSSAALVFFVVWCMKCHPDHPQLNSF